MYGPLILVMALLVPPWPSPTAASDASLSVELGVEHFRWQEFDDDGRRLLSEHGPRFRAGASYDNLGRASSGPLFAVRLDGYLAEVDYDGQDTNQRFVASRTDYRGWRGEFDAGWRSHGLLDGGVAFDVFGGIGLEQWRRDINSSVNALGNPVQGLVEDYRVVYARAGFGIEHAPGDGRGYLSLGARYPLSIDEDVMLGGASLNLSPGKRRAAFLSYRISLDALTHPGRLDSHVRFYYEAWRFARSDNLVVGNQLVWQPKSHVDLFGVMFGVSF